MDRVFVRLVLMCFAVSGVARAQNLTGFWTFTSYSTIYNISSTASGQLTESETSISGQVTLTGTPCATTATVTGTIIGQNLTIMLTEGNQVVTLIGTVPLNATSLSGSYSSPSGGCTQGDFGSWSGSRITLPTITGVTSAADYTSGFTLEGYTAIFGYVLSAGGTFSASPPYPATLGGTQLSLCPSQTLNSACVPTEMTYVSPSQINVVIHQVPAGPTGSPVYFIVSSGGTASTAQIATYDSPRAEVFRVGYDCYIDPNPIQGFLDVNQNCGLSSVALSNYQTLRAAITDLSGNVVYSGNPARVNNYYSLWLTGLGPNPPLVTMQFDVTTAIGQTVTSIPVTANVSYTGESQFYPGLFQVNFLVSPQIANPVGVGLPACGSRDLEVFLYINNSIGFWLPVAIKNGDVPCQ